MTLLRRRLWGALLLMALAAFPTSPVEAATASQNSSAPSLQSTSRTPRTGTRPRRRARRAPPGGVYARHAVVIDPATGEMLYEKNAAISTPIASLSKLMTVIVFLEQEPYLERRVEVT